MNKDKVSQTIPMITNNELKSNDDEFFNEKIEIVLKLIIVQKPPKNKTKDYILKILS
jgi:hypothetical protein